MNAVEETLRPLKVKRYFENLLAYHAWSRRLNLVLVPAHTEVRLERKSSCVLIPTAPLQSELTARVWLEAGVARAGARFRHSRPQTLPDAAGQTLFEALETRRLERRVCRECPELDAAYRTLEDERLARDRAALTGAADPLWAARHWAALSRQPESRQPESRQPESRQPESRQPEDAANLAEPLIALIEAAWQAPSSQEVARITEIVCALLGGTEKQDPESLQDSQPRSAHSTQTGTPPPPEGSLETGSGPDQSGPPEPNLPAGFPQPTPQDPTSTPESAPQGSKPVPGNDDTAQPSGAPELGSISETLPDRASTPPQSASDQPGSDQPGSDLERPAVLERPADPPSTPRETIEPLSTGPQTPSESGCETGEAVTAQTPPVEEPGAAPEATGTPTEDPDAEDPDPGNAPTPSSAPHWVPEFDENPSLPRPELPQWPLSALENTRDAPPGVSTHGAAQWSALAQLERCEREARRLAPLLRPRTRPAHSQPSRSSGRFCYPRVVAGREKPFLRRERPRTPAPLHLTLLIDTSGSMSSQGRLRRALQLGHIFVQAGVLSRTTTRVITFDESATVVVGPHTPQGAALSALERVRTGGGTCLHRGVALALKEVPPPGEQGLLVLITDGCLEAMDRTQSISKLEKRPANITVLSCLLGDAGQQAAHFTQVGQTLILGSHTLIREVLGAVRRATDRLPPG